MPMPGLSNAALIGLSVSVVAATAVTVAAVNGLFDPLIGRDTAVVAKAPPAADQKLPAGADAVGQGESADEPAEAITPRKKPRIDIVRVEPTGDAVIAGQSDAGALVAVVSNGVVVGKGVANETGDWAIVIDDPLRPGSHDIVVEARKEEGSEPVLSDDMVAVHIPKNESEGVFVATNRPGAPTEVLQAPPAPRTKMADRVEDGEEAAGGEARSEGETVTTAADQAGEGPPEDVAHADNSVAAGSDAAATGPEASAEAEPGQAEPDAPVEVARAEPQSVPSVAEAPKPDAEVEAEPEAPAEQPNATVEATAEAPVETGEPQREAAADPVTETASEPEPETAASKPRPEPIPAATEPNRPEQEAAPTATEAGAPEAEPEPAPTLTAEARSEPEPEPVPAVTAEAEQESEAAPKPTVTVEAVEAERGQLYVAGQSTGSGAVRVYIEDKYVGEAKPNPKGQWLVTAPETIDPGQHSVRADQVEDDRGTVSARAEVVFERDPDEVALKRIAVTTSGASDVAAGAEADAGLREIPAMIIRKGDNLWRISRRHYGKGIRYTTIYQANQDQIRDPDLIYPGQVFLLPERDLNWANN